jgi:septum formation protein
LNPFVPESVQSNLILASRSPRRIGILRQLGFEFRTEPAHIEERSDDAGLNPFELPQMLAGLKAGRVAERFPEATVIGADTVVIIDDRILNKPRSDEEAAEFIRRLSGRVHIVATGLAVLRAGGRMLVSGREETSVRFRRLTDQDIQRYVAFGEGRDKAGAYGVQGIGAGLVRSIEGCYFNVVGLPVALLINLLNEIDRRA